MELKVVGIDGKDTGRTVQLNEAVFGIEPNTHVMWLDVKHYRANNRQGTHATKEKSMVSGSTRKLIRQKGGGGARRGSIKTPLFPGGARVFGPQPRYYGFKLNQKIKRLARISALSSKMKDDAIMIMERIELNEPKTKDFINILKNTDLENTKTLFVCNELNKNVFLSSRNIGKVKMTDAAEVNTYQILDNQKLVIFEDAVGKINELVTPKEQEAQQ
ncbi:MAG: 50S ribosomal protein L4 [Bacteroidales bacterium]|jgi:large subunit ribosomal protein L4|nr:50S ribosomal protein L4 [Bacteroidales bacterium]